MNFRPQWKAKKRNEMPESTDRRAEPRMPVNADTSCSFVAPVVSDFGPAKIKDISMQGIGLIVGRRVEPDSLLVVTLTNTAKNFTKTVMVQVAHATPQPGGCLVGGIFTTPLTYQELTSLVM
jgi:hypothetical protein